MTFACGTAAGHKKKKKKKKPSPRRAGILAEEVRHVKDFTRRKVRLVMAETGSGRGCDGM
jgi:hypothetical protein